MTKLLISLVIARLVRNTIEKDIHKNPADSRTDEALKEIYERLRPGEPKTADSSRSLLVARFFDPRRYDLAAVGRYKLNKKLNIKTRLLGQTIAENLVDPETGEILVEAGTEMTRDVIDSIAEHLDGDLNKFVYTPNDYAVVTEPVVLQKFKVVAPNDPDRVVTIVGNANPDDKVRALTTADILAEMSYFLNLAEGIGKVDDIDHLGNRRIRAVGELLANQFRIGLARMERNVRERMSVQDNEVLTATTNHQYSPCNRKLLKNSSVLHSCHSSWTNTTHCQSCHTNVVCQPWDLVV